MPNPGGTIYAIGAVGTSAVKIGSTRYAVEKRMQTLQIGQPASLHILAQVAVEADLGRVERQVHAFLAAARTRGEWFDLPMDEHQLAALVVRAVEYIAAEDQRREAETLARQQTNSLRRGRASGLMAETLGERLSAVRERRDVTQGEVAQRASLPQQAISRLERGDRTHVRSDVLARLAIALDVSADVLLGLRDMTEDTDTRLSVRPQATLPPQLKRQRTRKAAPVA